MKVIKVVDENADGGLVSTFARGKWQKEYMRGVETKPDIGYLFAYPSRDIKKARANMGNHPYQYWLAEAEVVGRVQHSDINVISPIWHDFWKKFKLHLRRPKANYLLCNSITLIKILE